MFAEEMGIKSYLEISEKTNEALFNEIINQLTA